MVSKILNFSLTIVVAITVVACGNNSSMAPMTPTHTPTTELNPTLDVSPMATQTPVLLSNLTSAPIIALTSRVHSVPVSGVFVFHLAIDDKYLYWTTGIGSDVYRYPLDTSTNGSAAIIASSHFDPGTLSSHPKSPLIRADNWLIFEDSLNDRKSRQWELRALDIEAQTELNLTQGYGSMNLYTYSADGEWVAWRLGDITTSTSIINAQNLQTGQKQELARSDNRQHGWEELIVSSGRAAASQRGDEGRTLSLFDLDSGQSQELLSGIKDSDMYGLTFEGNWIAWKLGRNSYGSTALYNLENKNIEILPDWGVSPLLVGNWLTWETVYQQPLYVVDLENHQVFLVAEAQPGEELTSVAIYGNLIAWCRLRSNADHTEFDSRVEWRTLP